MGHAAVAGDEVIETAANKDNCSNEHHRADKEWLEHKYRDDITLIKPDTPYVPRRFSQWTLRHAFFASSGGIAVASQSFHSLGHIIFTPRGVIELARAGILPQIDDATLDDKSRADMFAKVIVCLQASWFIAQCIGRYAQGLTVTLLELHTLGHIVCALLIYMIWWNKPYDVQTPLLSDDPRVLDMAALFATTPYMEREAYGTAQTVCIHDQQISMEMAQNSHRSPPRKGPPVSTMLTRKLFFRYRGYNDNHASIMVPTHPVIDNLAAVHQYRANQALSRLSKHGIHFMADVENHAEYGQIFVTGNYVVSECSNLSQFHPEGLTSINASPGRPSKFARVMYQARNAGAVVISTLYGALHLAAWKYPFPTDVEAWIWRSSTLSVVSSPVVMLFIMILWSPFRRLKHNWVFAEGEKCFFWRVAAVLWAITALPVLVALSTVVVAWIPGRFFLLVESLASLRSVPADAYSTPAWSLLVPHFT